MPNNLLQQVKDICQAYEIRPTKNKGQNFLIDTDVLEDIVSTANLSKQDRVLEVGPGLGILTEELVKRAGQVVSVELDKRLYDFLKVKFAGTKNLELVNQDILKFNPQDYKLQAITAMAGSRYQDSNNKSGTSYKLVANLPYNITSALLKKYLTTANKPQEMTLLVQKEVAKRMCAQPGQMSLLGLSIQLYSQPKIIRIVKAASFWPTPKVDSALVKLSSVKSNQEVDKALKGITQERCWQIAKVGFSAKRKQLQNNLTAGLHISSAEAKNVLKKAKFDPKIRAQNLSVNDWIALAKLL